MMAEYLKIEDATKEFKCQDCLYSKVINSKDFVWCMKHDGGVRETDFCSYGERRAE